MESLNTKLNDKVNMEGLKDEKLNVFYVTDPICVYCWVFEPVIRKFYSLYKDKVNFKVLMGGLLKDWNGFMDEANGISKPEDVKAHYEGLSDKYGLPIDGSLWLDDPITSSYPPAMAVKLVEEISTTSALKILRMIREEVLVFNRNVSKDSVLEDILNRNNRNGAKIVRDIKENHALELLENDIKLAKELGVHAFPTIVITDNKGNGVRLTGYTDFNSLENALMEVSSNEIEPNPLPSLLSLFDNSRNIFFKEIEVMYDLEANMVYDFIAKNLEENSYEIREVLGKKFIIRK